MDTSKAGKELGFKAETGLEEGIIRYFKKRKNIIYYLFMKKSNLTISALIPCHNEEKTIEKCINSCLDQIHPFDEIVIVNDGSTDRTTKVLKKYKNNPKIKIVKIPKCSKNKSYAQERGLKEISSDIFVTTDADTLLDINFVQEIIHKFEKEDVVAVVGYVQSLKHNWLTAYREIDYIICQDIHKNAQDIIGAVFIISGCASAFDTETFRKFVVFDHDTLTEDLDITYKLHEMNCKVIYNRNAIVYTQDPENLNCYIKQMQRWYGGGWQNIRKHINIFDRPQNAFELSLIYGEGLIFATLIFIIPLINLILFLFIIGLYYIIFFCYSVYGACIRKRWDLLYYMPLYPLMIFVNSGIYLSTFVQEIIFRKNNLVWFTPKRRY